MLFSKVSIAYVELYPVLATTFAPGRFCFKPFERDESEVEIVHHSLDTTSRPDSKGDRVFIEWKAADITQ